MNKSRKNPLPKGVANRVALRSNHLNIEPRFIRKIIAGFGRFVKVSRVIFLVLTVLYFLGYQPALTFPPIKKVSVLAYEQQAEVISSPIPVQMQLPHPGYLSGRFSNFHPGVDIATGLGMPIHPIAKGKVEQVNFSFLGYGNHVIISHDSEYKSLYGHMNRVYVKVGQEVSSESTLGTVGLTGYTSGPHTHLEITHDGKYLNPLSLLPKIEDMPKEEFLKPYGGANQGGQELTKTLKPDFN